MIKKILTWLKQNKKTCYITGGIIILLAIIMFASKACSKPLKLTCDDAEKIVLEKVKAGSILECELSKKNYEIEILYQGREYEFIVNGNTGEIMEFDSNFIN